MAFREQPDAAGDDRGVHARSGIVSCFFGVRKERKIGGNDFLILNQQFNTLIRAGLPILRALDLLATRASAPKLRPILTQIRDRVREGKSLSEAVNEAGVFSKVYSTAILAGEKSGNLSGVLEYYIAYQKVSTGVKKKIASALVYPTLLVVAATCIVTYLVKRANQCGYVGGISFDSLIREIYTTLLICSNAFLVKIRNAEAFEICEYGTRPDEALLRKLFPFLPKAE